MIHAESRRRNRLAYREIEVNSSSLPGSMLSHEARRAKPEAMRDESVEDKQFVVPLNFLFLLQNHKH